MHKRFGPASVQIQIQIHFYTESHSVFLYNNIQPFRRLPCADREGGQGSGPPPLKNHKNIGFSSNTGPDPLKNCSYQSSIQWWAIIGTPAKRHFMAFRWRADDDPLIVVLGSFLPSSKKKKKKKKKKNVVKVGPPLTKLSGSAHDYDQIRIIKQNMTKLGKTNLRFMTIKYYSF